MTFGGKTVSGCVCRSFYGPYLRATAQADAAVLWPRWLRQDALCVSEAVGADRAPLQGGSNGLDGGEDPLGGRSSVPQRQYLRTLLAEQR